MTSPALAAEPRPTPHMVCGLPGSGKSTLARQLEHELDLVRLTPDEWMLRLGGDP